KMASFSDRVLSVPGKEFWFKNDENRTRLIDKLKELLDTILILLNILFLAVYQLIYQSNMATPVMKIPQDMLISAFIITPFLGILLTITVTVFRLYKHK
ncbi:MAG: hypothetical protein JXR91_10800, partial [Deltaproteobacteria bacterium]|nr:hypothetical protein [Deltaproteobacteria bacterium]